MTEYFTRGEGGSSLTLERVAAYILVGLAFLLPLAVIPTVVVPFQFTKTALVLIVTLVVLLLFLVFRLRVGALVVPREWVLFSVWLLPFSYLLSALFSQASFTVSLTGQRFEVDTFGFMLAMTILLLLSTFLFRSKEELLHLHIALLASFFVLSIFQGLRLVFGTSFLSFDGVFPDATANLVGKWNDLAIFCGLIVILALSALESGITFSRLSKIVIFFILLLALFFLIVVNFSFVWFAVGLFALGFFVNSLLRGTFYRRRASAEEEMGAHPTRGISFVALLVLVIAAGFIFGGADLRDSIASFFNITQIEARPSFQTTLDIALATYRENFLLGSGPNTFAHQWSLFKPQGVNDTVFWNIDFTSGFGIIPTSFVVSGILGGLAWLVFFGLFLLVGFRRLVVGAADDSFAHYLSLSTFLGSLFLWILVIAYIPNAVLVALAFLLTGAFLASLRFHPSGSPVREVSFAENPRLGFVMVLLLILLLILSIAGLYVVSVRYASAIFFQKAAIALNVDGNAAVAREVIDRAIRLDATDAYYRLAVDIGLARLNQLLNRTDASQAELRDQFQALLGTTIQDAQRATELDQNNYQNWIALGRVYEAVVPLGLEGAYENARRAYERAENLAASHPAIQLQMAQLELARGNRDRAREFIGKAVTLKGNYTDAIFLLSQIQIQEGEIADAIASVEAATVLAPQNPVLFFQLGLLHYSQNDNARAIAALEQAVNLNPIYSNARYFLGLAYEKAGRTDAAIAEFERIAELNPDNVEVELILGNLRAGRDPFANVSGPPSIEDRAGPPFEGE